MEQRVSNGSSIYLSFPLLSSFYASDKNSFFRGERKKKKEKKKRKRKNERIKDSRKSFATVLVMTDKKKERERGKASRRGRGSVVLSGLIGTRSVLSARCQSIIENARRLDERRRDRHRYIYIHLYIRPYATKQPTSGKRPYFYVTCILRGWSGAFRSRGGRKRMNRRVHGPPPSRGNRIVVARTSQ